MAKVNQTMAELKEEIDSLSSRLAHLERSNTKTLEIIEELVHGILKPYVNQASSELEVVPNPKQTKADNTKSERVYNIAHTVGLAKPVKQPKFNKKRLYTPLKMTYTQAFDHLKAKGLITPLGPYSNPPLDKRPSNSDGNKYCKYHQSNGHTIEGCFAFKNLLQNIVDDIHILTLHEGRNTGASSNTPAAPAIRSKHQTRHEQESFMFFCLA